VGTPFNGFFRDKTAGAAPLAGILLLEKSPSHRLEAVGAGQAAAAVATQITPPVGLDEVAVASTSLTMIDLGARLVTATEVRRLHFTPDAGFWPLLTDALGRGHR
jgi:hypothetical protein